MQLMRDVGQKLKFYEQHFTVKLSEFISNLSFVFKCFLLSFRNDSKDKAIVNAGKSTCL